jgi:hypothetical protein
LEPTPASEGDTVEEPSPELRVPFAQSGAFVCKFIIGEPNDRAAGSSGADSLTRAEGRPVRGSGMAAVLGTHARVGFAQSGAFVCKFIIGEPNDRAVCCGAPVPDGKSW